MRMSIVNEVLQAKSTARNNKVNDCGFEDLEARDFSVTAEFQCKRCIDKYITLRLRDEELRQVKESLKQTQRRMHKLSVTNDEISRKLADLHAEENWCSCFGFFPSDRVTKVLDRAIVVVAILWAVSFLIGLSKTPPFNIELN